MKTTVKLAVLAAAAAISLSSCVGNVVPEAAAPVITESGAVMGDTATDAPELKTAPAPGNAAETTTSVSFGLASNNDDGVIRYTPDDFYMECLNVGYIAGMRGALMISDREQLEYAKVRYPLSIHEDADEQERWLLSNPLTEPFEEMTEKYPVEEYTYLLEYISESGGDPVKIGGLIIDGDRMYFYPADDGRSYDSSERRPDVCTYYCYIAAVPKGLLPDRSYSGWILPDANDMYQDADYSISYLKYDTSDIYDIYGGTNYLIRSRDEYDSFLAMSSHITDMDGLPVIRDNKYDFGKAALAVRFRLSSDIKATERGESRVTIDGSRLDLQCEPYAEQDIGICTYMISATVPVRFLTELQYDGWAAPAKTETREVTTPDIDRGKYSKDALILTAEDIPIYGEHTSRVDLSENAGRYILHGEKGTYAAWEDPVLQNDDTLWRYLDRYRYNTDFDRYPESMENYVFMQYAAGNLQPYALVIDGGSAEFLYTGSASSAGSTIFYAAVPEELLKSAVIGGWKVHDSELLTSFEDVTAASGVLLDIYGSNEEYECYIY